MDSIELKARAKINISLDVTAKRPDGYHDLKMIMQTIDLHDKVFIKAEGQGIEVSCDSRWVPSGSDNIAYKAADLLKNKCNIRSGIKIKILKRIPVAAGLAGGSTNAAAVLKGINALFGLGLQETELMQIGKQVGADVPFCIAGGTMLAEGIGDILTRITPPVDVPVVLLKPKISVSTKWVYKNLDLAKITVRPDTGMLLKAIREEKADIFARNMVNVLETVTVQKYGIINELKEKLLAYGALGSLMSGSGPSVFGIFPDGQSSKYAYEKLKNDKWDCFLTHTSSREE